MPEDTRDVIATIVVTDRDNYLIGVGAQENADILELGLFAAAGYTIRTMSYKEYKELHLIWIWNKKQITP